MLLSAIFGTGYKMVVDWLFKRVMSLGNIKFMENGLISALRGAILARLL